MPRKTTKQRLGATLVEYGIITGLVAVLAIGSVATLGGTVGSLFDTTRIALASAQ